MKMRYLAGPVGYLATSIDECLRLAKESAAPSHNSKDAVEAAQATAVAIYMAREGRSKEDIRNYIEDRFHYNLRTPYDALREEIHFARTDRNGATREANHERIVGTRTATEDALIAFLTGRSYEDVIRNAIALGGDADTEAAIAGGIAAAYYGVPDEIILQALNYIPSDILSVINQVDGANWQPSKLIPPKSSRWSRNDVVIFASDAYDTMGESSYYLTHPSRFRRLSFGFLYGISHRVLNYHTQITTETYQMPCSLHLYLHSLLILIWQHLEVLFETFYPPILLQ